MLPRRQLLLLPFAQKSHLHAFRLKGNVPFSWPVPRELREIVKPSMFDKEDGLTIRTLWKNQFEANHRVSVATMLESTYWKCANNMKAYPFFLVPLPMNQSGVINLLCQIQEGKHLMFTGVEEYRKNGVHSTPYAIGSVFKEYAASKGIALWRIDAISLQLEKSHLDYLLKYIFAFYTQDDLTAEHQTLMSSLLVEKSK